MIMKEQDVAVVGWWWWMGLIDVRAVKEERGKRKEDGGGRWKMMREWSVLAYNLSPVCIHSSFRSLLQLNSYVIFTVLTLYIISE